MQRTVITHNRLVLEMTHERQEEGAMMRIARAVFTFIVVVGGFLTFFPIVPPNVAALDVGFQDDLVTPIPAPTALAFTPDGRLLATTQPGQLRVYTGGALLATPALDLGARRSLLELRARPARDRR